MLPTEIVVATKKIAIPSKLYQAIDADQISGLRIPDEEKIADIIGSIERTDDITSLKIDEVLGTGLYYYKKNMGQQCVLCLGIFASCKALVFLEQGKPQESLGLLTGALILENQVLPDCGPEVLRILARRIASQTDEVVKLSAALGSAVALLAVKSDVSVLLGMVETVWEPEARPFIRVLEKTIDELNKFVDDKQLAHTHVIMRGLTDAKKNLSGVSGLSRKRKALLNELIESWIQVIQQETVLVASAQYSSEGLDYESIARQAHTLIGQVEQRLRMLIVEKYNQQYQNGWLEHIRSQHKSMYDYWVGNQERDQAAFKAYRAHTPDILEYARFEDLSDLITAQWHLFRDVFDFGYDTRNKTVFYDKMFQIAKVRNPLAHHRTIPENELLRARVLCTDILLALDCSNNGVEDNLS